MSPFQGAKTRLDEFYTNADMFDNKSTQSSFLRSSNDNLNIAHDSKDPQRRNEDSDIEQYVLSCFVDDFEEEQCSDLDCQEILNIRNYDSPNFISNGVTETLDRGSSFSPRSSEETVHCRSASGVSTDQNASQSENLKNLINTAAASAKGIKSKSKRRRRRLFVVGFFLPIPAYRNSFCQTRNPAQFSDQGFLIYKFSVTY